MPIEKKKIGEFQISKGKAHGFKFKAFDYVPPCKKDKCPIKDICPYDKKGACTFEREWLYASFEPFKELIKATPNKFLMQVIGQHLMPLYRQLVRMQKLELAVKYEVVEDNKGSKKIHPVFKELRDITETIFKVWKNSGLLEAAKEAGFFKNNGPMVPSAEVGMGRGQQGYYEEMSGQGKDKK
jgi:hypothetical protein